MHCELHHAHCYMGPGSELVSFPDRIFRAGKSSLGTRLVQSVRCMCAVRTRLRSWWWFRCTLSNNYLLRGDRNHDMGVLSWL